MKASKSILITLKGWGGCYQRERSSGKGLKGHQQMMAEYVHVADWRFPQPATLRDALPKYRDLFAQQLGLVCSGVALAESFGQGISPASR